MAAIAALNTRLVSDGNLSKNRAIATALAQDKIEEIRTNLINSDTGSSAAANNFAKIPETGNDACGANTYACGSAGFARNWAVANYTEIPGSVAKNITVTVTWTDADANSQAVTLSSVVAWDNPLMQSQASDDDKFENQGAIPSPTGGGKLTLSVADLAGAPVVIPSRPGFSLKVVEYGEGVAVYDENVAGAQVWLITDPGVVEISGQITLGTGVLTPNQFTNDPAVTNKAYFFDSNTADTNYTGLRSIAADAGVCQEKLNQNSTSTDAADDYLDFLCYVGSRWYGRIGVMAVEESSNGPALDGRMVNIQDYGSGQKDRLCPQTYRYGNTCEVTGNFTLTWNDVDNNEVEKEYCENATANNNFQIVEVDDSILNDITGEPMFLGTLMNQNFKVQTEKLAGGTDSTCGIQISGSITLTGTDATRSISTNAIYALASGTASCNAVTQTIDPFIGNYQCDVPTNWTGTITFNGINCTGAPVSLPIATQVTTPLTGQDVSISGCYGAPVTIRGEIGDIAKAFNPVATFKNTSGAVISSINCTIPGTVDGVTYDYVCANIPPGTSGQVEFKTGGSTTSANCSTTSASVTNLLASSDAINASPLWDLDTCSTVAYEVKGNINIKGSWKIGSTNITTITVKQNGIECFSATPPAGKAVSYVCPVNAYPGTSVNLTVHACTGASTPQCITFTPSSIPLTLGSTNPIPMQNFNE